MLQGGVEIIVDHAVPESQKLVETVGQGTVFSVPAQVPLPDQRGLVSGVLQGFGQGHLPVSQHFSPQKRPEDAGSLVVPAREQAGPGRRAERGHIEFLDSDPFPGQTVQVRRPQDVVAVDAHVAVTLVVGQNQDDVRPPGGRTGYEMENGADHDEQSRSPSHALHHGGSHLKSSFRGAQPGLRIFGQ